MMPVQIWFSSVLMFCCCSTLFGQVDSTTYTSKFSEEVVRYKSDSFLLVTHYQSVVAPDYHLSIENTSLLKFIADGFDSLIIHEQSVEDLQIEASKSALNRYLSNRYFGENEEEFLEDNYYNNLIRYMGSGIFSVRRSTYTYSGGAHGYGHGTSAAYDLESKAYFYLGNVFKPGVEEFIYKKVKEELTHDGQVGGYDEKEADKLTEGSRDLSDEQYSFNRQHLSITCQSYETFYGIFYAGYPGFQVDIPYSELKKYIIKDSPLWRLYMADIKKK